MATGMTVSFAHPSSPWERGTNENTNGLVRQFFPKGTEFDQLQAGELLHVQNLLNGRPRKVLNYRTPKEAFTALVALDS
jgi:IS30 family transposase